MKNKEIQKKQAGITLVALVVTIIILIILATITLNATLREDGLINQAKNAKLEYRAATVEEEVMRWKAEKEIAKYAEGMAVQERSKFIEDQKNRGLLTEEEAKTATDTGEVQIGSKTIQYGAKTLVELFQEGKSSVGLIQLMLIKQEWMMQKKMEKIKQ